MNAANYEQRDIQAVQENEPRAHVLFPWKLSRYIPNELNNIVKNAKQTLSYRNSTVNITTNVLKKFLKIE